MNATTQESAVQTFKKSLLSCAEAERNARTPADESAADVGRLQSAISSATSEAEAMKLAAELEKAERLAKVRELRQGDSDRAVTAALGAAYRSIGPALVELEARISEAAGSCFDELCEALRGTISPLVRNQLGLCARIEGSIEEVAGQSAANYPAAVLRGEIIQYRRNNIHPASFSLPGNEHLRRYCDSAFDLIESIENALPSITADSDSLRRASAAFAAELKI